MKTKKVNHSGLGKPLIVSLLLHFALVGALLWGADFMSVEPKPTGTMVEAVVIDPNLVHQQANRIKEQRTKAEQQEQDRLDKLRRESALLEKNREAEEERIRDLKEQQAKEAKATREAEKERLEKEQERKEAEERTQQAEKARKEKQAELEKIEKERIAKQQAAEKATAEANAAAAKAKADKEAAEKAQAQAKAAAAKAQAEKEAIEKAEQERLAKEQAAKEAKVKAAKEKAEQEAKAKAAKAEADRIAKEKAEKEAKEKARLEKLEQERLAKEKREQEAALSNIFSGLENEDQKNNSARSQFVNSELDRYGAIYKQLIASQLLTNDSFSGKSCKVNLRLIPAGNTAVLGKLSVISGDSAVCAATSAAVTKVNAYPLPNDPDIVEQLKNINLTVVPN